MFIATLIATEELQKGELSSAQDRLQEAGCSVGQTSSIIDRRVADIPFSANPEAAKIVMSEIGGPIDFAVQSSVNRKKKMLISDMDSTMITVECIDELADYAGIKEDIAEITERAMQGELDFEAALRERVHLLSGLETSAIEKCLREKVEIMPGAETLVRTMKEWGAHTVLVSGGFTSFAKPVSQAIGFESFFANVLGEKEGKLTGKLEGSIVDAERKQELLRSIAVDQAINLDQSLAVGDGANDIPMIKSAGMGVAYHAKAKAKAAADVAISHNDLSALLYVQGVPSADWVCD